MKESRERMPKINIDMRKIIDGTVLFIYSRTWRCLGDVLLLVKRVCYRFYPPHNYPSRSKEISRSSSPLDDRMQRHFFFFVPIHEENSRQDVLGFKASALPIGYGVWEGDGCVFQYNNSYVRRGCCRRHCFDMIDKHHCAQR